MPILKSNRLILLVSLAVGVLLWGAFVTGEQLRFPETLQPLTTRLYRIAYLLLGTATGGAGLAARDGDSVAAAFTLVAAVAIPALAIVALGILLRPRTSNTENQTRFSRRQFLTASGGLAAAAGIGTAGYSVLWEPDALRVQTYRIPVRDLPPSLDGITIAHVSDTHYGPFITLPYLRAMVERVNALKPDLILLTGDYVHRTPRAIEPGIRVLGDLRSTFGALAVLGNHDHWEGAEACRAVFREIDVPLIDNARRVLTADGIRHDVPEEGLCLAGVGDYWEDEVLIEQALDGVPQSMPRFLLSHNPDVAESFTGSLRVDLQLSGHTHGGQVCIPGLGTPVVPSNYGQKYAGGLCQGPLWPVLVSRGVGMAMLPVRLGVPPEIGAITLTRSG